MGTFGANAAQFGGGNPDWNKYFDYLDLDNSGSLDFQEFKTGAQNRSKALNDENLDKIFDILDHNKSGTLTENQLMNAFEGNFHGVSGTATLLEP